MNIKILGGGCPKCKVLYNNVMSACRELKIEAVVEKVEDMEKIMTFGVMSTPALVINDQVVGTGQIKYAKIKELIELG
jgi:small redox-active disulfide protein 2